MKLLSGRMHVRLPSDASTGASLTVLNHRPEAKIGVRRSQHRTSAVMWPSRLVDTPTHRKPDQAGCPETPPFLRASIKMLSWFESEHLRAVTIVIGRAPGTGRRCFRRDRECGL